MKNILWSKWLSLAIVIGGHLFLAYCFQSSSRPPANENVVFAAFEKGSSNYDFARRRTSLRESIVKSIEQDLNQIKLPDPEKIEIPLPDALDDVKVTNPSIRAEQYFRVDELQSVAIPLTEIELPNDTGLLVQINARLEIYIGRDGVVRQVEISLINFPEYREQLKAAVFATEFKPATKNGFAVNSIKVIEIAIKF